MAVFTWDHIHLRSPDPEETARFYVEMLGGKVTARGPTANGLRIAVDLSGLDLFIEQVPTDTAGPPTPPFLGFEHIGLGVSDMDAVAAELKAKGVRFVMEPTSPRPGLKIAFIEGPQAVRIELLERSAA